MGINYTDGDRVEQKILNLVNCTTELGSENYIGHHEASEWAIQYHLCPERANLIRHLDFSNLDVLELGAGMGGVSRYLCEKAKHLTVVEGTEQRYRILSSRLRDLNNWNGIVSNIQDVKLQQHYDVVCLIGVLEYAGLYFDRTSQDPMSPYRSMLNKALEALKPEGKNKTRTFRV